MQDSPKICAKCGSSFKRSPFDSTVNCPDCRGSARVPVPARDVNAGYVARARSKHARGLADARAGRAPLVTSDSSYRRGYAEGIETATTQAKNLHMVPSTHDGRGSTSDDFYRLGKGLLRKS